MPLDVPCTPRQLRYALRYHTPTRTYITVLQVPIRPYIEVT